MHEMSLVRNMLHVVLEECSRYDTASVTEVHLAIGEMRDVVEDYVPELFRYLARDTVAAQANVVVRRVPVTVRCGSCGEIFAVRLRDKEPWACPRCQAAEGHALFSGNEFRVDSIEIVTQEELAEEELAATA